MTLAGTGRRLQYIGVNIDSQMRLASFAGKILDECYDVYPEKMITGMAQGWDTAIALASIERGITLVAAVPFAGQESVWDKWAQDLYFEILSKCAEVHTISPGGYASAKYIVRDEWMVDKSHQLVAWWEGRKTGGTYKTIKYAESKNKMCFNTWNLWESFLVGG